MNKDIMKQIGFKNEVTLIEAGLCPFCSKKIDMKEEFRDDLSLTEYSISGLCQKCQDEMFGK